MARPLLWTCALALLLGCPTEEVPWWDPGDDDSAGDDDTGDDDSAGDDDDTTPADDDDTTPGDDDDDTTADDDDDTTGDDDDTTGDDDDTTGGGTVQNLSLAHARFTGEAEADHAGSSVDGAGDVSGDGVDDIVIGAEGESTAGANSGAVYIVSGALSGTHSLATAHAKFTGVHTSDMAGAAVAGAGDVDGDGVGDLLVGAYQEPTTAEDAGAAYLLYGPLSGTGSLSSAAAVLLGEDGGDWAGSAVAGLGDVDGDGLADLAIAAKREDSTDTWAGAVYLVYDAVQGEQSLSSASAKLTGEAMSDNAGSSVAGAGDVNGDGFADVLIGAQANGGGGASAGAAYLVYGPVFGTVGLASADAKLTGEASYDYAGGAVSSAGDMDGDGIDDILIGAAYADGGAGNGGAAYLLHGSVWGTDSLSVADARLLGEYPDNFAGVSVAGVGDVDGDGLDDLLVGASGDYEQGFIAGAAYLLLDPVVGDVDLADASLKLVGEGTNDWAGRPVAPAGDVDHDGRADFLVAAPREDSVALDAGAVYLMYGSGI